MVYGGQKKMNDMYRKTMNRGTINRGFTVIYTFHPI